MTEVMNSLSEQLDQVCRLSGARWAAWLKYERKTWKIVLSGRLSKARQTAFREFVDEKSTNTWLSGALNTGRSRSRSTGSLSQQLGCQKVFTFSDKANQSVLVVGADGLTADYLAFFRILAKNGIFIARSKTDYPENGSNGRHLQGLKNLNQRESSLIELAAATVGLEDTAQVINLVIQKLAEIFETDRISVFLLDANLHNFRQYFSQLDVDLPRTSAESNLASHVIKTGALLRLGSATELSQMDYRFPDIQSALVVPLKTFTRTIGALMVESERSECFNIYDEYLMMVIANQVVGTLINIDVYRETQARSRNLELIHQVIKNIVGLTDETEVAQLAAALMAEYFGYEFTVIMMADEQAQSLEIVGIGGTKANLIEKGTKFSVTKGIIGRVFRTGESFISNDISDDPEYFSILSWRAGSEICVPLQDGDKSIGVINLERSEKGFFTETDLIVTEALAGILSSVLMNAHRYKQLNKKVSQLEAVRATSLDLSAGLDLDSLLKQVVHRVRELVGANGAEIGLVEEEGHGIRVQTSDNPWYDFTGHLIPIGKGIAGMVLQSGGPIRVSDYFSWSDRLWPGTQVEFKAAAGVPLKLKGKVIGTLVVMDDKEGREFSIEDINTLQMIAQNISLAIHNAQLYKDLDESIEAQRQTENMLVQSERMAAAGRLTASIAHEINNPLQALQNCLYLADHAELGMETRQKYITMARTELERLNTTVQRMLDYYRPGAKDRQLTDINELIRRILELVNPQMIKNNIFIETNLDPKTPSVMAVTSQIQQVLLNLMLNAMEAMPDGGKIFITTKPCDELTLGSRRGRRSKTPVGVEINVRDTGPGVSLANKEQIFEPFVSTKKNGIGLGLSVSYGIIQAHGGTLNLISDDEPGAYFRIALPLEVEQ